MGYIFSFIVVLFYCFLSSFSFINLLKKENYLVKIFKEVSK